VQETNAQQPIINFFESDTFAINFQNKYFIQKNTIIAGSEEIILRGKSLHPRDYSFDVINNCFALSDTLNYSLFDSLVINYNYLHTTLKGEYKKRILIKEIIGGKDTVYTSSAARVNLSNEDIFGRDIQKSGTLVRGFTVGTTRDFTLNSGLRLQMAGKLSENIEIVAALTDENTPIQPEGNTERLEELDKVFIEIRHPNAIGTFGDFEIGEKAGEFARVNRKLQGLKGEAIFEGQRGIFSLAGARGKYNSNRFSGLEGVQGPYRLYGANNENDIIVIAGSEKVFVDGEEMKRGEQNQYTIEYSNAELTFTPSKLITSASRITVEFEYTDRRYNRNFLGGSYSGEVIKNKMNVFVNYFREGDNENSPIDLFLSENDISALESAGDDRIKASKSGVSQAQADSNGIIRGVYTKVDTLIAGESLSYYKYAPGTPDAIYNVEFTYVGEAKGDYDRITLGNYEFKGKGYGGYLPVKFLPLPELKQLGSVGFDIKPFNFLEVQAELAASSYDKNNFSSLDDGDNNGFAGSIYIKFSPQNMKYNSKDLGKITLDYRNRQIDKRFTSLDRFNTVEFDRDYNSQNIEKSYQSLQETGLRYQLGNAIDFTNKYGLLRTGSLRSDKFQSGLRYNYPDFVHANYDIDFVKSTAGDLNSSWLKQRGRTSIEFLGLTPGFEFSNEERKENRNQDSLNSTSFRFSEISPSLLYEGIKGISISGAYSMRNDYSTNSGYFIKESDANTAKLDFRYSGIEEINTNLSVTRREKYFTRFFREKGYSDNITILIKNQSRFRFVNSAIDGDLFYEVQTQRTAKYERVFLKVPRGTGNYLYLGDLNDNGVADEYEFQLTTFDGEFILTTIPTDELFPVIDLRTNTRWRIEFEKFRNDLPFENILRLFSTETVYRIEENTKEKDTKLIYFLNLSRFLSDSNTVRGSIYFQQDLHLMKNDPEFSLRLRYTQRRSLNQYSNGPEKSFYKERALRVKYRFIREIANQTEFINENDFVTAPAGINRARTVISNSVVTDFSYRPIDIIEVGIQFKTGRSTDYFPEKPTVIDINSQILRFNLSLTTKGRLRMETERTELTTNTTENAIPFELTRGNFIGKNYYWRLNFDYRIASNLQTTVAYDGRILAGSRTIHTMRAEARAYF